MVVSLEVLDAAPLFDEGTVVPEDATVVDVELVDDDEDELGTVVELDRGTVVVVDVVVVVGAGGTQLPVAAAPGASLFTAM